MPSTAQIMLMAVGFRKKPVDNMMSVSSDPAKQSCIALAHVLEIKRTRWSDEDSNIKNTHRTQSDLRQGGVTKTQTSRALIERRDLETSAKTNRFGFGFGIWTRDPDSGDFKNLTGTFLSTPM